MWQRKFPGNCTGGFHKDRITAEEIREVQIVLETVTEKIVGQLR